MHYFLTFISFTSSDNDLYSDNIISIMMKENGNAATMSMFCKALNPSADNKITAISDCETPQMILIIFGGCIEPSVVCIPKTNVAESADVMKNVLISITATIDNTIDIGI